MNGELEHTSLILFGFKIHRTVELLNDVFRNNKAKSDPVSIHVIVVINESKKLKQLSLVFFGDSNAGVHYLYLQVLFRILFEYRNHNLNTSFLSKFECIGLQPQQNLHNPLLISYYGLFVSLNSIDRTYVWNDSLQIIYLCVIFIIFIHLVIFYVFKSGKEF